MNLRDSGFIQDEINGTPFHFAAEIENLKISISGIEISQLAIETQKYTENICK